MEKMKNRKRRNGILFTDKNHDHEHDEAADLDLLLTKSAFGIKEHEFKKRK